MTNITIAGLGYVGSANAVLLAQHNDVVALDIDAGRVALLNAGQPPVEDADIARFLRERKLQLRATTDSRSAYAHAELVLVCTPTDYDPATNNFNTSTVEAVIREVMAVNPAALIVIKSTVPVGFTAAAIERFGCPNLLFSPEFLREGKALHDNLHPSRIVVGEQSERAAHFARLLQQGAERRDVPVLLTNPTEAEAIKLFANTYLAMRVAFFNELDSFCATHALDTRHIIEGVCLDTRIGNFYNNPSFGYGGYCLPKDTRQLLANYRNIPQNLIQAIVQANVTRQDFIADDILQRKPGTVGIHRLVMKEGADNVRSSSVLGILERLAARGIDIVIFEPVLNADFLLGFPVLEDLAEFKRRADLVVTNRLGPELADIRHKVYTRDITGKDT